MKSTEKLLNELKSEKRIENFTENNSSSFNEITLSEYLKNLLITKQRTKAEIIQKANLNKVYGYNIFSGEKSPSRDKVLAIALAFSLSIEETQYLLKYARVKELYVRHKRDSFILFALNRDLTVIETNQLLLDMNEEILA